MGGRCRTRRAITLWTLSIVSFLSLYAGGGPGSARTVAASRSQSAAYQQPLRPQFHWSPRTDFTNDPNGLVFYQGEYHLFYQAREFADIGNPEWGQAVSTDLVHWTQLPIAVPKVRGVIDGYGQRICSGSVVVDRNNTSGFGTATNPPLVAAYTDPCIDGAKAWQAQSIAYSVDRGRTWTKYAGNPVLDLKARGFRDPKVIWHEPTRQWIAPIAYPDRRVVAIFGSPNLKDWKHLSDFDSGGAECPDLFPMRLEGTTVTKWIMMVASGNYWVGEFDGTTFAPDNGTTARGRLDYGSNYYAAQTFSDVPGGRRLLMAWMSDGFSRAGVWTYLPWQSNYTVVRELTLRTIDGLPQVTVEPVAALRQLRGRRYHAANQTVAANTSRPLPASASGNQIDIEATIDPGTAAQSGLKVMVGAGQEVVIGYSAATNELYVERPGFAVVGRGRAGGRGGAGTGVRATLPEGARGKPVSLRVLVDRSAVEIFCANGARAMSLRVVPIQTNPLASAAQPGDGQIQLSALGGVVAGTTLRVNAGPNGPLGAMESARVTSVAAADAGGRVSLSPPLRRAWPAGTLVSNEPAFDVSLFATGGEAKVTSLDVWQMRSAW